jgi:predicted ATP-dependent endonuclease of OLD family
MWAYLEEELRDRFEVRTYLLDSAACKLPPNGVAAPQDLSKNSGPLDGNPRASLIRVDPAPAQRAFRESDVASVREDGERVPAEARLPLTAQLQAYYKKHLDPFDSPQAADLVALEAIEDSQQAFHVRLNEGFKEAIRELEALNYPGIADPRLRLATQLRPSDVLKHSASVQYELGGQEGEPSEVRMRLPEDYNGLGYQHSETLKT